MEGVAWWQRGSEFQAAIDNASLQPTVDSTGTVCIDWQPFLWNGDNSELERRKASGNLLAKIEALEKMGREYAIIAHSHGGSILSSTLLMAAQRGHALPKLRTWITVGTPFIEYTKSKSLLRRLNNIEKLIYLSLLVLWMLYAVRAISSGLWSVDIFDINDWPNIIFLSLVFVTPFLVLNFIVKAWKDRNILHKNQRICKFANNNYGGKFVPLWHPNDEAIFGLQSAHAPSQLFGSKIALEPIINSSVYLFPIIAAILYWLPITPENVKYYLEIPPGTHILDGLFEEKNWLLYLITEAVPYKLEIAELAFVSALYEFSNTLVEIMAIIICSAIIYFFAAVLGRMLSPGISRFLNAISRSAIKSRAIGNDTRGEISVGISATPLWIDAEHSAIDAEIAQRITTRSDAASVQVLTKLRRGLNQELGMTDLQSKIESFSAIFVGDELLHTTYFEVADFRELIRKSLNLKIPTE